MNWGQWIIVAFLFFAVFIGGLVYVCVREDISLVSSEYYQDELLYEQQIVRINNANALVLKPILQVVGDSLILNYADADYIQSGQLQLFRPSDASLDKTFSLMQDDSIVRYFNLVTFPAGMYKARMKWEMSGKEYFIEKIIHL